MFCLRLHTFSNNSIRFTTIYTKTKSLLPPYYTHNTEESIIFRLSVRHEFHIYILEVHRTLNAGGCAILIDSIAVKHVHFKHHHGLFEIKIRKDEKKTVD